MKKTTLKFPMFKAPGIKINVSWNEADPEAAKKSIDRILEMKVGKRCAMNEIYWKANDVCNTLPLNASATELAAAIRKAIPDVTEEVIRVVLD